LNVCALDLAEALRTRWDLYSNKLHLTRSQCFPESPGGLARALVRRRSIWIHRRIGNQFLKIHLAKPTLNNVTDDLASVGTATSAHVESALVRLFHKIVDSIEIAAAAPEDFLLNPLGKAGYSVIDVDRLIT
jgi:hypothetical protein